MFKIEIICISKMRKGAFFEIIQNYQKRLQWSVTIREFESSYKTQSQIQKDEEEKLLGALNSRAVIIALDERGKSIKSVDFAKRLENYALEGSNDIQFIIGDLGRSMVISNCVIYRFREIPPLTKFSGNFCRAWHSPGEKLQR